MLRTRIMMNSASLSGIVKYVSSHNGGRSLRARVPPLVAGVLVTGTAGGKPQEILLVLLLQLRYTGVRRRAGSITIVGRVVATVHHSTMIGFDIRPYHNQLVVGSALSFIQFGLTRGPDMRSYLEARATVMHTPSDPTAVPVIVHSQHFDTA